MEMKFKRNLLVLCGTLAAGAAFAQSSVTIFGVVDTNLQLGRGSVANKTALSSAGWGASRIGFRGTEDLGGGMKAGFWLEAGINSDDGSGAPTSANNQASGTPASAGGGQGLTFARRSLVTLGGNWGEIKLGRDYVPPYLNVATADPFGNSGVGATLVYANAITGLSRARVSNAIAYQTPDTLGGFRVDYVHYLGENLSNTPNSKDGSGNQARVYYEKGPLIASVAYGKSNYAAGDPKMSNIWLQYDFGFIKPMVIVSRDRLNAVTGNAFLVGAIAPIGPHQLKASISQYKTDAAGSPKATKFAIGDVYWFSKRSLVYATYAHVRNSGGSATSIGNSITGANQGSSGFDLGLAHTF
jgi:predicted porin